MKWDNLAFYLGINYWNANINGSSKWGKNMADNRIRFVIFDNINIFGKNA